MDLIVLPVVFDAPRVRFGNLRAQVTTEHASTTSSNGRIPEMNGSGSTRPLVSRSKATCAV
jgi:hypothetical protein